MTATIDWAQMARDLQPIGPEEHPCDKCGVMVSELLYHGRDKPDGTSEYLCPDCPSEVAP